jgi:hypothetical protein
VAARQRHLAAFNAAAAARTALAAKRVSAGLASAEAEKLRREVAAFHDRVTAAVGKLSAAGEVRMKALKALKAAAAAEKAGGVEGGEAALAPLLAASGVRLADMVGRALQVAGEVKEADDVGAATIHVAHQVAGLSKKQLKGMRAE